MAEEPAKQEGSPSPEDEIRELERKLAEKKRAFADKQEREPEEKELLREVLREHIEQLPKPPPSQQPQKITSQTKPADDQKEKADDRAGKQARDEHIRALIEIALTKTISDAVNLARAQTPYLLDELHDHLVDDYYEKLVQLRKLEQL